jgi:hypothetical protein
MRAWLKVLSDRHPQVTWVPVSHQQVTTNNEDSAIQVKEQGDLARSA